LIRLRSLAVVLLRSEEQKGQLTLALSLK